MQTELNHICKKTNLFFKKNEALLKDTIEHKNNYADYLTEFRNNQILINPLSIYLLKNKILSQVLIKNDTDNQEVINRFSIKEQKIKVNTSKTWSNYITYDDYQSPFKHIFELPYDNNQLLNNINPKTQSKSKYNK